MIVVKVVVVAEIVAEAVTVVMAEIAGAVIVAKAAAVEIAEVDQAVAVQTVAVVQVAIIVAVAVRTVAAAVVVADNQSGILRCIFAFGKSFFECISKERALIPIRKYLFKVGSEVEICRRRKKKSKLSKFACRIPLDFAIFAAVLDKRNNILHKSLIIRLLNLRYHVTAKKAQIS
jgi:hypothetical protein